jgi:hypothetical protein
VGWRREGDFSNERATTLPYPSVPPSFILFVSNIRTCLSTIADGDIRLEMEEELAGGWWIGLTRIIISPGAYSA